MQNPLTMGSGQAKVSSDPSNVPNKSIAQAQKQPTAKYRYFFSARPDNGIPVNDKLRIKFKGNYLKTNDTTVAEYLIENYGNKNIKEITQTEYDKAHTLHVPEPEAEAEVEVPATAQPKVPQA